MSSIIIAGDTSGSVTLQAPSVAGSTILTLPATSGTVQTSGAGFTTNGVAYASSTSALTTGSALQFNGTDLGLGVTPSVNTVSGSGYRQIEVGTTAGNMIFAGGNELYVSQNVIYNSGWKYAVSTLATQYRQNGGKHEFYTAPTGTAGNTATFTQAMTLDASGNLLVGTTSINPADGNVAGSQLSNLGSLQASVSSGTPAIFNRKTDDGNLVGFLQDGTLEGTISVSGTTVSYNGGNLSRWAQMLTKPELFKGTVMSNLDEMNVYTKDGQPVDNEQLNKVKVSDTEGDVNVAGVFVNWTHDDAHNVDEINMAMTGDMIIRIAQGTTVVRGDLLMSAGDGTAKPQGDDIIRSKTVAKVTSNHVTCTYADGSYCVPCVLMAC